MNGILLEAPQVFSAADQHAINLLESVQMSSTPDAGRTQAEVAYAAADHPSVIGLAAAVIGNRIVVAGNAHEAAQDWFADAHDKLTDQPPVARVMAATVAARTLIRHGIFRPEQAVGPQVVRSHLARGEEALRENKESISNPHYTGASLRMHQAVAEAVLPDGSAVRGAACALGGLVRIRGAHYEPLNLAERPPVTTRQLVTAGALALSRFVPGNRARQWRQNTAAQLTNRRMPDIRTALDA